MDFFGGALGIEDAEETVVASRNASAVSSAPSNRATRDKCIRRCVNAPLIECGDGLLGDFAGRVLDEGEHGAFFAVSAAELDVDARGEHMPGVADDAVGILPLADKTRKLDIFGAAGHNVAADYKASGRDLFAL